MYWIHEYFCQDTGKKSFYVRSVSGKWFSVFVPQHSTSPLHCRDGVQPLSPVLTARNWKPSYALVTIATWYMKDITVLQRYLQSYSHYLVMPLGSFQPESSKKLLRSSDRKMHHVLRQPLNQRLSLRGKRKLVGSSQKFSWKQQSHTRWNYKDDWFGYFLVPCDFFGLWCVFSYNFLPYFLFISVTLKLSFWLGCPFFHSYFSLYVSILIMVLISSHI